MSFSLSEGVPRLEGGDSRGFSQSEAELPMGRRRFAALPASRSSGTRRRRHGLQVRRGVLLRHRQASQTVQC